MDSNKGRRGGEQPPQQEQRELRTLDDVKAALEAALPDLRRIAMRLCRNHADAEDLVQSLCVRVLQRSTPTNIGDMTAWLAKSLKHMFIDQIRSKANRPSHESLEDKHRNIRQLEADPPEPPWQRITVDDIREAASELKSPYGDVYKLHNFEGLSYEQIAQRVGGITKVTVGTRLNRARSQLRESLAARFGFQGDDGPEGDGEP